MQSFEAWYGWHHTRLLAALRVRCGDVEVAREALDEACSRALSAWGRVGAMAEPTGWVYRVAVNHGRRLARRRALETLALRRRLEPRAEETDGGEVWDAVRRLPARQRDIILLRYVVDLPEADIAAALGISRGAVSASAAKARATLAVTLGDHTLEEEGR